MPQYPSHLRLLVPCAAGRRRRRIDAVLVPTVRPVALLDFAIDLARELGCPVVLLCSSRSQAEDAATELLGVRGVSVVVPPPELPRHWMLELPSLRTDQWLSHPYADTANKRNIALLVARALRWRRVLFLDDDITALAAPDVERMAALMGGGRLPIIGWRYLDFADNSVACHALRSSGEQQDVFLGAGALLVDVTGDVPFFPAVYNDDWLFWHDVARRREIGLAGTVRQLSFNPFQDLRRAHRQEFGDVLAEGLYALLHARRSVLSACLPGYWHGVVDDRRNLLADTQERLWKLRETHTHTYNGYEIQQVISAVDESRQTLETFAAEDFAAYTSQWRFDLFRWRSRLHLVPEFGKVADALGWLGITDVHVVGEV